ncbi:MAG: NUDIX hydrolase [Candidatus Paceibacterota bacterium]
MDKELHRIAITAIIYRDDGRFLITRRNLNKKASPGKWTVPGGGLNVDDYVDTPKTHENQWYNTVEKTLRREVKEEVGLEIEKPEYLTDLTFIRPDNIPVLVLSYYAKYSSGEVVLNEESIDFKWVSVEEAKSHDLIDGILEEIEMVDKKLRAK